MLKHFPHKVLLIDCNTVKKARIWCIKEFGKQPLVCSAWKTNFLNQLIYDVEKGTWYNKVGGEPKAFYFKCPIDAIAFKLRWL